MNVLIVGDNSINDTVLNYFLKRGMNPVVFTDVFSLRSLTGETGNFTANTTDGEIKADYVVITEQKDGLQQKHCTCPPASPDSQEPVVFLLDYYRESPMSSTIYALENAVKSARKKRQVYYLAKFIRTAGRGVEQLYRVAREAGVTFVKYDELRFSFDTEIEEFTIQVYAKNINNKPELCLKTKNIYSDGNADSNERFTYLIKKLNLSTNKNNAITEDTHFLTPALTSRKGVFYLSQDLAAERLDEGLDYIYSCINLFEQAQDDLAESQDKNAVEIDGKKCVFCYNCYRSCPHAALEPDMKQGQMQCLSKACYGCGTCISICPASAITFINEVNVKHGTCPPASLILYCENTKIDSVSDIKNIDHYAVPCGGFIDLEQLSTGLKSYNKIISVVCPDDACRHFSGNKRACVQTKRLQYLLDSTGLSQNKIKVIQVSHAMPQVLYDEVKEFTEEQESKA